MTTEIRRGTARFVDREPGRRTQHAFSFGAHYDPALVSFGPMTCHDDHVLGTGRGFETHRHADLDIVSYVVSGTLEHTGPDGTRRLPAGSLAHLHTGAGVEHAEVAVDGPCRFVQTWLSGLTPAGSPSYEVVAGGSLDVGTAHLDVVDLAAGETHALPVAARVHAFVATGALTRNSLAEPLAAGDALLLDDERSYEVTAAVPTTLLVWTFV